MMRVAVVAGAALLIAAVPVSAQMATAERVEGPGWWPTKRAERGEFVGARQCAPCHNRQAATQLTTSMARTAAWA